MLSSWSCVYITANGGDPKAIGESGKKLAEDLLARRLAWQWAMAERLESFRADAAQRRKAPILPRAELQALVDARQCTGMGEARSEEDWGIEREANDGAAELLIPERLGAPLCAVERARVEHIDRLARTFRTSFVMSAIRFVELTMAPCAIVASKAGEVEWALESLTFPGAIAKWRRLHPGSVAARLPRRAGADREGEIAGVAWKSRDALVERAWRTGPDRALSWIVAAA